MFYVYNQLCLYAFVRYKNYLMCVNVTLCLHKMSFINISSFLRCFKHLSPMKKKTTRLAIISLKYLEIFELLDKLVVAGSWNGHILSLTEMGDV